jgi:hypothetical protein
MMSGSGETIAKGGLILGDAGGGVLNLVERTLTNSAGSTGDLLAGAQLIISGGGTFSNAGTFVAAEGTLAYSNSGANNRIENTGTFTRSGGAGDFTVYPGVAFDNSGIVNVETGRLALQGGDSGASTGAFNANGSGVLNFQGGDFHFSDTAVWRQLNLGTDDN